MNEITIFENEMFGRIRVAGTPEEPLFCATDIAKSLGYANPAKAIIDHCKGVTVLETPTGGGIQPVKFITESEVYRLIFKSNAPNAEEFTDWVTSEVLPSIRKTGGYIVSTPEMTNEEIMARALIVANETIRKRDEQLTLLNGNCNRLEKKVKSLRNVNAMLEDENAFRKECNIQDRREKSRLSAMVTYRDIKIDKMQQQILEAQPKLDYLSNILANQDDEMVTEIAKDYGMSGKALNKLLNKLKIQYKVNGTWVLYANHDNKGYTNGKKFIKNNGYSSEQTVWTPRGRIFIYEELKKHNILPLMERK